MARKMKDSGIEWIWEIPEGWELRKGKSLYRVATGKLDANAENPDGDYPFFTCSMAPKRINSYSFDCEALLVAGNGLVGFTQYYKGKFDAYQRTYVLSDFRNVLPSFLRYYVSVGLPMEVQPKSIGSVIQFIKLGDLLNFNITLPSIEQQTIISNYLEFKIIQIDAILSKTRSSIEEYKKLKQAIITQAVTKGVRGKREMKNCNIGWIKELPADWGTIPSKYLFKNSDTKKCNGDEQLTASQQHGIITQKYYTELTGSKVVLANKGLDDWKHVEPFDFIISLRSFQGGLEMSETTGCITWHYIVLKPCHQIYSYYYKWLFKSEIYIRALQRTCNFIRDGQDLRYSNFVQVPLFEPPLEEQKEIADYLNVKCAEIDGLIAKKEQLVKELESYKKSLIYEVVTGKREV